MTNHEEVEKVATRAMTAAERYDVLVEFKTYRDSGLSNNDAAGQVGVPFITLYSWLRDKLWMDDEHTEAPIELAKHNKDQNGEKVIKKIKKIKKVEKVKDEPKKVGRPKGLKNYSTGKIDIAPKALEKPVQEKILVEVKPAASEPIEPKPIIVWLPNGLKVSFSRLNDVQEFTKNFG